MSKYITGDQQMINNLNMQNSKLLANTGEAVEKTCIDISNHAKSNHEGNMAHAESRYRNRTSNLTNSVIPELLEVTKERVHGIVSVGEEYAATVEFGNTNGVNVLTGLPNKPYPFMTPALVHNMVNYQKRLSRILR